jgi:hypothetical protein
LERDKTEMMNMVNFLSRQLATPQQSTAVEIDLIDFDS